MKCLIASDHARNLGNLILRLGTGLLFIPGGWMKISTPAMWPQMGGAMANIGVSFSPTFWGFMAALAEFGGAICLILGLFTRPVALLMAFTMAMAALHHLKAGDGLNGASHALQCLVVFVAIMLAGPGRFSVDAKLSGAYQAKL